MGLAELGSQAPGREPHKAELVQPYGVDLHAQHLFEQSGGDLFDTVRVGPRIAFFLSDIAGRRPELDPIAAEMQMVFRSTCKTLFSAASVNLVEATETLILAINHALIATANGVRFCSHNGGLL